MEDSPQRVRGSEGGLAAVHIRRTTTTTNDVKFPENESQALDPSSLRSDRSILIACGLNLTHCTVSRRRRTGRGRGSLHINPIMAAQVPTEGGNQNIILHKKQPLGITIYPSRALF